MTTLQTDTTIGSSILGRYRVVRKIARGGMGAVYLARTEGAEGFARPVVIKRVLATLMGDDEVAQMFVREARILSELQHPNIVPVLDFGQDKDGAYVMVLDYVNGYHLGQWNRYRRKSSGAIPSDVVLYIMGRVLDALHYAHTLTRSDGKTVQIIHRDVTPSNVLLDLQGQVKLLDFGIARVSGDETVMVTETPQVKGKLPYLALEIFQGKDPSAASDVYSAGVVLYELLTGHNPFMGRETADIFHKVLTENLASVHAVCDDAPEDIDAVLAKAVNRDPAARYQTAAQFAEALSNLQERSDVAVADDLRKQIQQDFQGEMPGVLKLEPLSVRDAAWRGTIDPLTSDFAQRQSSDPGGLDVTAGLPLEEVELATVQAAVPHELLDQAHGGADSRATVPPPGRERRSRASVDMSPPLKIQLPPALGRGEHHDPLVFDRVTAPPSIAGAGAPATADKDAVTTPPPELPGRGDAAAAPQSHPPPARASWVLPLAVAAVAISGASLWFSLQSADGGGDKEIVVIERGSARPAAVVAPPPVAQPAPAPPVPDAAVAPAGADPKTAVDPPRQAPEGGDRPGRAGSGSSAARPPDPRALTKRFGHKQGRIEACFAQHAKGLEGRPQMAVHFVITESGKVKAARLEPEAVGPTPLGKCVLDVARGTHFGQQQREFAFRIPLTARVVAGGN